MSTFFSLLKREFKYNTILNVFKRKKVDYIGTIVFLLLGALILYFLFKILYAFVGAYKGIGLSSDILLRAQEMGNLFYLILTIFSVFTVMSNIYNSIFNSKDLNILLTLPVRRTQIYFSKAVYIYCKVFIINLFFVFILNYVLAFNVGLQSSKYFFLASLFAVFIISLLSLGLGSIFSLLFYQVINFLKYKYLVNFILIGIFFVAFLFGYSYILKYIKDYIESGDFKFFFSIGLSEVFNKILKYSIPTKFLTYIVFRVDIFSNLGYLALVMILLCGAALGVVFLLFNRFIDTYSSSNIFKRKSKYHENRSIKETLFRKEFKSIFRNNSYIFSYFSLILIVPIISYTMTNLSSSVIYNMLGLNVSFEMSIFSIILFSSLLSVISSNNITRESKQILISLSLPIDFKLVIKTKIFVSFIISTFTNILCILTLLLTKTLVFDNILLMILAISCLVVSTTLISAAEIYFVTKLDLKHFNINNSNLDNLALQNRNFNLIFLILLIFSVLIGVILILLKVFGSFLFNQYYKEYYSFILLALVSGLFFIINFISYKRNIDKYIGRLLA